MVKDGLSLDMVIGFPLQMGSHWVLFSEVREAHIDGSVLLRLDCITSVSCDESDRFLTEVLRKEGVCLHAENPKMKMQGVLPPLRYIQKRESPVGIESIDSKGEYFYEVGQLKRTCEDAVILRYVSPTARWDGHSRIPVADMVLIRIEDSYSKLMVRHARN